MTLKDMDWISSSPDRVPTRPPPQAAFAGRWAGGGWGVSSSPVRLASKFLRGEAGKEIFTANSLSPLSPNKRNLAELSALSVSGAHAVM